VPERPWHLSVDAQHDPKIQLLSELVQKVVRSNTETLPGTLAEEYSGYEPEDVADILNGYYRTDFYISLNDTQKDRVQSAAALSDDHTWRYGDTLYTDGLWDAHGPTTRLPVASQDALILTGASGSELFGLSKRLDRFSEVLEPDSLKRAVLLGGVAMAVSSERYTQSSVAYLGPERGGLRPQTHIGGTFHGDFWTERRTYAQQDAVSPLGEALPFAPLIEKTYIPAYHSVEPQVMSAVLAYAVGYAGLSRQMLFDSLTQQLQSVRHTPGGAFGDFGQDTGDLAARTLDGTLQAGVAENAVLLHARVSPDDRELMMRMTAKKEGIEFATTHTGGRVSSSFILPVEEIPDYVVHMVGSGFGRTSQSALLHVIQALTW